MRQVIQYSAIVLLSVCSTLVFAHGYDYAKEDSIDYSMQPNFQVANESDYERDGKAVYFFGGYVYTYRFYNNSTKSVIDPVNNLTYTFKPKSVFPTSFNGFEVGVGKEATRHIDFQAAYIQQLQKKKSGKTIAGIATSGSIKTNGLLGDVGYVFNPDDEFQVMAKAGVMISETTNYLTVSGSPTFTLSDSTKIDPAAGLDFIFQFSKNVAFRLSGIYVAETQTSYSDGEADAFVGLSYSL